MKPRLFAGLAVAAALALVTWLVVSHRHDRPRPVAAATAAAPRPEARPHGERPGREDRGDATVLVDDDPAGGLRLEGLVLDADDRPVGGATVVVSANPSRTVKTETDGSFAFDKLVGRSYTLLAR